MKECGIGDDERGLDVADDALRECGVAGRVERDDKCAAEDASPKCGEPRGGILAPEKDAIAGENFVRFEKGCEASGGACDFAVGGGDAAIAEHADDGGFARVAAKVVEQRGEARSGRTVQLE